MNKFDDTVKELKSYIDELEKKFTKKTLKFDDETKEKARALVDKAEEVINSSIEKVKTIINDVKDEEKLNSLLDKIKAKSKEAVEFTLEKVDALTKSDKPLTIDDIHNEIMDDFDKLKETDIFKKTTVLLKQGVSLVNEFLEKPEVKETIKKAKTTTINLAEKGVEGLKKILDDDKVEEKKDVKKSTPKKTTAKKESTKKAAPKKTTAKKATTKKTTKNTKKAK